MNLAFPLELKALNESGEFSGLASTYGNTDRQGDVVVAGAFTDSLRRQSSVPLLKSHNQEFPIGLAKLSDSREGLLVSGTLDMNVQAARESYSGMKAGYLQGLSIGYVVPKGGAAYRDDGVREIRKADVYEVSIVPIAANSGALITSVKSSIHSLRDFERFLHGAGWSKSQAALLAKHGWQDENPEETEAALLLDTLKRLNAA